MDLDRYLARIGYLGPTEPSAETLRAIHRSHLFSVPFENLDIHASRPILLNEAHLFEKIVDARRGGFCFEQNGLFAAVLRELGFEVSLLEANVWSADENRFGIPMDHMTLLVNVDGARYLADVGFGASFIDPLLLDRPEIQSQDAGDFRIGAVATDPVARSEADGLRYFYCRELGAPEIHLAYRFFLRPRTLEEYEAACHYMQTSPETHFTRKRLCSQWTESGRVTLSEDALIRTSWAGVRTEHPVDSEEEFHRILEETFGIALETKRPGPDREPA